MQKKGKATIILNLAEIAAEQNNAERIICLLRRKYIDTTSKNAGIRSFNPKIYDATIMIGESQYIPNKSFWRFGTNRFRVINKPKSASSNANSYP